MEQTPFTRLLIYQLKLQVFGSTTACRGERVGGGFIRPETPPTGSMNRTPTTK